MSLKKNILKIMLSILLILVNNPITSMTIGYLFQDIGFLQFITYTFINIISLLGLLLMIYYTFKMLIQMHKYYD